MQRAARSLGVFLLVGMALFAVLLLFRERGVPAAAHRHQCLSNLDAIKEAIEAYAMEHDGALPQDIVSANGKPLLSWRVRILKQLGYRELYESIDKSKAYDSPRNVSALYRMPEVFQCPSAELIYTEDGLQGSTNYLLVVSSDGSASVEEVGRLLVLWTRPPSSV